MLPVFPETEWVCAPLLEVVSVWMCAPFDKVEAVMPVAFELLVPAVP
jgi:hypothetical protein